MLRRFASHLVLFALLTAAWPVQAAENALDAFSTDASVVIRLKKPDATIGKLADLVDLVSKGAGDQVRGQAEMLGQLISNPTLAGVDRNADWWVAMYATGEENEEPDFVFVVPATDLKAMKEALGDKVQFIEHGKFGVYTEDEEMAKETKARIKGEGKSISTLIDKESTAVFDSGDVSVFINIKQLATAYKDEIKEFSEQAKQKLEDAPDDIPGGGGIDTKQIAEVLGKVFEIVAQGLDDAQSCTISLGISKDGLIFEDLVRVKAGSPTDKMLVKSAPGALPGLSTLPAGYLLYFGLTWDMSDFAKLNQWLIGFSNSAVKPEAAKELKAALDEVAKLKIGSLVTAFGLGDVDEGAVRSVSVTEVDNPAKMRDLSQKVMKAMQGAETPGIKQTFDVKKDAEKYGKNSADVITVKTEATDADNPLMAAQMARLMALMFGPDGMTTRAVYLKDKVVQTLGGGKPAMTDALAAADQKPADSAKSQVHQSRAKLGAKSNVVVLLDLANLIAKIVDVVVQGQLLPIPLDGDQVKGLQSKPSYFGLSAGTEPQGLRVKTHIPVEQMQGIAKIVEFVMQNLGGIAGGQQ